MAYRVFFKTTRVHTCHDQSACEPRPKKCNCRKLIGMREAVDMVERGEAEWLLEYSKKGVKPTWDIILPRVNKTPRAHTLESCNPSRAPHSFGQIERIIDRSMSDGGKCMNWIERHLDGGEEEDETHLFEEYHRLELEMKYKLFGGAGPELIILKEASDGLGTVTGERARIIDREISKRADEIKQMYLTEDLSKGQPVLLLIGLDQRTYKKY